MASCGEGGLSWGTLALSTLGMGPFWTGLVPGGLLFLHVDKVFPGGHWLCLLRSIVWDLLFVVATTTAGGPPLISNWWFEAVTVEQLFSVRLHFDACLAEWLLLVITVASLVVRLFSNFVLSRLEASFPSAAPWCSQRVRHRGGTDGKEEQSTGSS